MEYFVTTIGFSFEQKRTGSLAVLLYSFLYYKIISRLLNLCLINKSIVLLCFKGWKLTQSFWFLFS
jgi:hypothetical protein